MNPYASARPWPSASAIGREDARNEETCEAHSEEAVSEARKAPYTCLFLHWLLN